MCRKKHFKSLREGRAKLAEIERKLAKRQRNREERNRTEAAEAAEAKTPAAESSKVI